MYGRQLRALAEQDGGGEARLGGAIVAGRVQIARVLGPPLARPEPPLNPRPAVGGQKAGPVRALPEASHP